MTIRDFVWLYMGFNLGILAAMLWAGMMDRRREGRAGE